MVTGFKTSTVNDTLNQRTLFLPSTPAMSVGEFEALSFEFHSVDNGSFDIQEKKKPEITFCERDISV